MNNSFKYLSYLSDILFLCIVFLIVPFNYFAMISRRNDYAISQASFFTFILTFILFILCTIYLLVCNKTITYTKLDYAVIVYSICIFISLLYNWEVTKNLLRDVICSYFWVLFYFVGRFSFLNQQKFYKYFNLYIFILFILTILFFIKAFFLRDYVYRGRVEGMIEAYFLLCIVPFILYKNKLFVCNLMLIITFIVLIISAKRTGILAFSLLLIPYLLQFYNLKRLLSSILLGVIMIIAALQVKYEYWDYIIRRTFYTSSSRMSGREYVWQDILFKLKGFSFPELLFGRGRFAVQNSSLLGVSAHNDYLQLLFDHGIITLIPAIVIVVCILYKAIMTFRTPYFVSNFSSFVIVLFLTMSSHLFHFPTYFIFIVFFEGMTTTFLSQNVHTTSHHTNATKFLGVVKK